ncbi:MAG: ABC transporter permease subunit [Luteolibacter sp.]
MSEEPRPVPSRFKVSRGTLLIDRAMTQVIRVGGLGITLAVFGIFFFIFIEIMPLFRGAQVEEVTTLPTEVPKASVMGADEWGELPFLYDGGDDLVFYDLIGDRGAIRVPLDLPEGFATSAVRYRALEGQLLLGGMDGTVLVIGIEYKTDFSTGRRVVSPGVKEPVVFRFDGDGGDAEILDLDLTSGTNRGILAMIQRNGEGISLRSVTFTRRRGLGSVGGSDPRQLSRQAEYDLSNDISGNPTRLIASTVGDNFLVANDAGEIFYFCVEGADLAIRQNFTPFEDLDAKTIGSMDFILGDNSFILTSSEGVVRGYSLFIPYEGAPRRTWGHTKTFDSLDGGAADFFLSSPRNKSFLYGRGSEIRLANLTSESERWRGDVGFPVVAAALDGKGTGLMLLDQDANLHVSEITDRHPEAGFRTFFGKVWYEGRNKPDSVWQSTGATDDFESKLSMMPLIFGSIKGTFYAMLFAVPIALLAAIYCAAFCTPAVKRVIKPTMEIMASLPSVVLGFLAGLVLAPMIETKVPSVLMTIIMLPLAALAFGWFWSRLPVNRRSWLPGGTEWVLLLPIAAVAMWVGWSLGPLVEQWLFFVRDADGNKIADFRLWWPEFTGTSYSQRNSLVLGFMMGFAVIPIIFTISEDALSNVPPSLTAASQALGASRWQTARTILIPVAAAGIFSALMIGFGRAVGETMIVVMASGNTPITEWNIFSGMRTLSANIAVELPEAPVGSTHYRALFLGAMILFLLTFAINTIAEILRQRLREKFRIV